MILLHGDYKRCPACQQTKHKGMFIEGYNIHSLCHQCRIELNGRKIHAPTMDWRKDIGGAAECSTCKKAITTKGNCSECREVKRRVLPKLTLIKGGKHGEM